MIWVNQLICTVFLEPAIENKSKRNTIWSIFIVYFCDDSNMFLFLIEYYWPREIKIYIYFSSSLCTLVCFMFYFNCKFYTLTLMRTFDRGFSYCRNFISLCFLSYFSLSFFGGGCFYLSMLFTCRNNFLKEMRQKIFFSIFDDVKEVTGGRWISIDVKYNILISLYSKY